MGRGATLVMSAIALGALLWPALDPTPVDSLPVSSYPMFARPKPRVSRYPLVVLRDESGDQRRLDAHEIGGTDQPMQAAMTVSQAIRTGTAPELCIEIASGLGEPGTIEIVTARGPYRLSGVAFLALLPVERFERRVHSVLRRLRPYTRTTWRTHC